MSGDSGAVMRFMSCSSSYGEGQLHQYAALKARLVAVEEFSREELIGRGSYGEVYKGTWNGRPVAIKKMNLQEVFDHEVNILCQLQHENIVEYLAHCEQGSFLITEYLPSGNLRSYLLARRDTPLPDETIHMVAEQLGSALDYMHRFHIPIFHRDVKSANILIVLAEDGSLEQVKLADVGVACTKQIADTMLELPCATQWTCPELLSCHRGICGPETDIYSYGVVLWELLTRRQPFRGVTEYALRADVAAGHVRLDTPTDGAAYLRRLFQCCTQFDPQQRPLLKDVLATLACVQHNPAEADSAFPVPESESRHARLLHQLLRQPSVESGLGKLPDHLREVARVCLSQAASLSLLQREIQLDTSSGPLAGPNPVAHQPSLPFDIVTAAAAPATPHEHRAAPVPDAPSD